MKKFIKKLRERIYYLIIKTKIKSKKNIIINKNDKLLEDTWNYQKISCYVNERKNEVDIDLSIIIPLYNSEKFIDKCVSSLLNQKTNFLYEIILVNDGSKDNTLEIINDYKKRYSQKIKVFNKKNGGISSARNIGLNNTKGKYIGFLDHDDYVSEKYVDTLLKIAYKNDADIVKCGTANITGDKIISKESKKDEVIIGKMNEKILKYPSYIWAGIYKSDIFKNVKFPDGYWYEDMITRFLLYRKSTKFVNTSEILHFRVSHANQATKKVWSNRNNKCLEQLYLIKNLVKDNELFNLENDVYFYLNVLLECSNVMVKRISKMNNDIKGQVFLQVYELLYSLYKEEYTAFIKDDWKLKNDIILKKRYDLWLLEEKI